jgi:hypothetical protein
MTRNEGGADYFSLPQENVRFVFGVFVFRNVHLMSLSPDIHLESFSEVHVFVTS